MVRRSTQMGALGAAIAVAAVSVAVAPSAAREPLRCGAFEATIVGTPASDRLVGTPDRDVIVALGGHDLVFGLGGNDVICGGSGRDRLVGGQGRDHLLGGPGRDRLVGNAGNDALIGGAGDDVIRGGNGFDRVRGSGGLDRCELDTVVECEQFEIQAPTGPNPAADVVVHISLDGLRSDHVRAELMPNLVAAMDAGASTLNARTDPARTQTLPNHLSQFTGLPVLGASGHQVDYNVDLGRTVHQEAARYVASVFDVVHDRGGRTAMYVTKPKFDMIDRSWNGTFGAPDRHGDTNGRDKIDVYRRASPEENTAAFVEAFGGFEALEFVFFHVRSPDEAGHEFGWSSPEYAAAVQTADRLLGDVLDAIGRDGRDVAVIVTADHGGPIGQLLHNDETLVGNFVVPMVVVGPGVARGADLYALNSGRRVEPGARQLPLSGPQPIRPHEAANLALDLLGYPPVDESVFNFAQDLRVR